MKMSFGPWPGGATGEREREFVALLDSQVAGPSLADWVAAQGTGDRHVHFLIVDVTPAAEEPLVLERELRALLVSTGGEPRKEIARIEGELGAAVRILFVGAAPGLDTWEEEGRDRVSRKKALEFYIRALQRAGLAHYGSVVEPGGPADLPPTGALGPSHCSAGLARSAIIGLSRHYSRPDPLDRFGDLCDLLRDSTRELLAYARKHDSYLLEQCAGSPVTDEDLIEEIGGTFQLGKRKAGAASDRLQTMADDRCGKDKRGGTVARGSYAPWIELDTALRHWGKARTATGRGKRAPPIATLSAELMRYQLLRDLGRCIGSGAIPYLRSKAAKPRDEARPHGILIVDDSLAAGGHPAFEEPLRRLLDHIGWGPMAWVTGSEPFLSRSDSRDLLREDRRLEQGIEVSGLDGSGASSIRKLDSFALILTEVESATASLGPNLVQRLHSLVAKAKWPPPIIVVTRTETIGHIQQSLNLGAVAYVLKERLLQLPFQMRRALEVAEDFRYDTPQTSAFRKLSALRPERRARLHRERGLSFVHGGVVAPGGELLVDRREEMLVRELPKADLHCHLGTCISYPTIRALALNTVAYLLPHGRRDSESAGIKAVADRVTAAVVVAEWILSLDRGEAIDPLLALALGAGAVSTRNPPKALPGFGLADAIVRWLTVESERVSPFEVASLLVAAICTSESSRTAFDSGGEALEPASAASYFRRLADALEGKPGLSREALDRAAAGVQHTLTAIASAWTSRDTVKLVDEGVGKEAGLGRWTLFAKRFEERVRRSEDRVIEQKKRAWDWLRRGGKLDGLDRESALKRLQDLPALWPETDVVLRDVDGRRRSLSKALKRPVEGEEAPPGAPLMRYVAIGGTRLERGLQRYLRGADLLGSEHLQYPENILLAAYSVTLDNALDNVIYAEMRCETTGYCQAGMNPFAATDLLCRAFDLAALFVSQPREPQLPLVRVNLLLAAKRHKDEAQARESVTLMQHYLRRRGEEESPYAGLLPAWWGRCRPIGFDVSGDESKSPEWMARILAPLADLSSPITIHAGEATTAQSIWTAVYRDHATRIGHGLRLGEEATLLGYCVSEGICMEMCPNSNAFTNGFQGTNGRYPDSGTNPRSAYPLRAFMQDGLEVALGTDNRYLHAEGLQTLTSEYLTAARLSNGLTRWEILQLVKAGFKNAFLPKKEVQDLLSAMEERVYRITARGWF